MKRTIIIYSLLSLVLGVAVFLCGSTAFAMPLPEGDGALPLALMGITVSPFKRRTMLRAIDAAKKAPSFLRRKFFKNTDVFDTVAVDVETVKNGKRMAPFVSPVLGGVIMDDQARLLKTYTPPHVKPQKVLTAADLGTTAPGTTIYSNEQSQGDILATKAAKKMDECDDAIGMREEWMCSKALVTGVVPVKGKGVDDVIDFQRAAENTVVLTGEDLWSAPSTSNPTVDISAICTVIRKNGGKRVTDLVFGMDAWASFASHPETDGKYDNRRIKTGEIDPKVIDADVTYLGTYSDAGIDVDMWAYEADYTDDAGVDQPFIPANGIVFASGSTRNGMLYGLIQDLEANGEGESTVNFVGERFPDSWVQKNPTRRFIQITSAPLAALTEPDTTGYMEVC